MVLIPLTAEQGSKTANRSSTYSLYGLTMASEFSFASHLAPGVGSPDLDFTCVTSAPSLDGLNRATLVYASPPYPDESGESEVLLYRSDGCLIVRFSGIADFYLWPERILCYRRVAEYHGRFSGDYSYEQVERYQHMVIEIYLLGYVLACWLEWRGTPTLHASAVVVEGCAVAFLSTGGGGKSSNAVALMQAGYPLLTDDILPVECSRGTYMGRPGYPQMRMWPEQAQHFVGRYEDLDIVHPAFSKRRVPVDERGFGIFCGTARPLACLYLPERRDPKEWGKRIKIEPVSRREAVMTLIGNTFVPAVVEALGLHPHRLSFFSQMIARVPPRRVVYPSGFEHLPRVRRAILDDLAGLAAVATDES
jgi:hypothetical protein